MQYIHMHMYIYNLDNTYISSKKMKKRVKCLLWATMCVLVYIENVGRSYITCI